MKITYSKLEGGGWGARVESKDPPKPGDAIIITKRDGTKQARQVGSSIVSANGVHICSLVEENPHPSKRGPCAGCGEGKGVVLTFDSNGVQGMCCYACAKQPAYKLSFS